MLTAARPLSDPRILSILGERAQQDDSKMICLLPRHSRLFAQPLVGEVRGAAAAGRFILRASAFQAKDIRPPYFSESLILESVRPGDLAGQPKSEASSLSSPGVRALRDEPTEAIPQNQREEAEGILSRQGPVKERRMSTGGRVYERRADTVSESVFPLWRSTSCHCHPPSRGGSIRARRKYRAASDRRRIQEIAAQNNP